MFKILLLAVLLTLIVIGYGRYKKMPANMQRTTLWRVGIGALLCIIIFMVITGRMHWVGALLGVLLPFARGAYSFLSQVLPLWLKRRQAKVPPDSKNESEALQEALQILGLDGNIERDEITPDMVNDAHRHLIQKLHPDRGGNDYLASKINQARDLLLKELSNKQ